MRLLLIEDDLQAAEYLVKGLRENGYEVEHSADGRDGLEQGRPRPYDVIIADRQLPHVDGLAIIRCTARARRSHAGADPVRARHGR